MNALVHFNQVINSTQWHWTEMGQGDPVVLIHGIPESWQCWQHQMKVLSTQFRVIAIDLPGYGQSDKKDGDYTGNNVAHEVIALLDGIGLKRFRLAGHDWGSVVGDHICDQVPERVEQYVRCSISLHRYDPLLSLHHQWNAKNPEAFGRLLRNPEAYVRVWFDSSCKPATRPNEDEIQDIIREFSYPGIAEAIPRYFRDMQKSKPVDYKRFTMPVLYVHGEHDPRQPIEYARDMEQHMPGLDAILLLDCGHFVTRERPREMAQAMMWFFHSMLASGLPIFDRSRHHGLLTKPKRAAEQWGINSATLELRSRDSSAHTPQAKNPSLGAEGGVPNSVEG